MSALPGRAPQRGVGLIEVLVALFVISIGVLSFAKTEALALSETGIAARRSIAAMEADSLAAAMHANEKFWQQTVSGVAPFTVTIKGSSVSNALLSSVALPSGGCLGTAPACTSLQMAIYDVQNWATQLDGSQPNGLLPNETATIQCLQVNATVPVTCTIHVAWSENSIVSTTGTSYVESATAGNTPDYTLYVQP